MKTLKNKVNKAISEWNAFKEKAREYRIKDLLDWYNINILEDDLVDDPEKQKIVKRLRKEEQ